MVTPNALFIVAFDVSIASDIMVLMSGAVRWFAGRSQKRGHELERLLVLQAPARGAIFVSHPNDAPAK